MRPPSSRSEPVAPPGPPSPGPPPPVSGLFDEVLAHGPVRAAVSDRAWLAAMLDAEAALARAEAASGLIPPAAATAITAACQPDRYDPAELGAAARGSGTPVLPLVDALRREVPPEVAEFVHYGATSQDILDTATMLVTHRALGPLLDDLSGTANASATLAREYRQAPMAGRTLLQHALPVTFGLKAAGWMVALDEAGHRLAEVRETRLAVQPGGAAGTQAAFRGLGPSVAAGFARELGLTHPVLPWHTNRTRIGELAGALATTAGVLAKIARDVTLLAQTGRFGVGVRLCQPGPGAGGDVVRGDDAGARAGRRRLAGGVAPIARAVGRGRVGSRMDAGVPRRADRGRGRAGCQPGTAWCRNRDGRSGGARPRGSRPGRVGTGHP